MAKKLKVYRTAIGFHDAYVAAPSQKAALEAWGSDANLFARGIAEEVSAPALMAAPLEQPGAVIKVLRGDLDAQVAALAASDRKAAAAKPSPTAPTARRKAVKRLPRPDRAPVEAAEAALEGLEEERRRAMKDFDKRAAALRRERANAEAEADARIAAARRTADKARGAYERGMKRYREQAKD
jgi:hypothetical protein